MRAALYVRVSTKDKGQDVENQVLQLKRFCQSKGYEIVEIFRDNESGRKGRGERAGLDAMLKAAARREFDLCCFWSLDRLSREGIRNTIGYLQTLESFGVSFASYQEPYLTTDNELVKHIVLGVMSYFAEAEAKRISERTKAGLERTRAAGTKLGRRSKVDAKRRVVRDMLDEGLSEKEILQKAGISRATFYRIKKTLPQKENILS